MESTQDKKKVNFFTDENGTPSSTRLSGFICTLALVAVVVLNIIYKSDWKLALVSDGVLAVTSIGCYYLRKFGLEDVGNVVKTIKG